MHIPTYPSTAAHISIYLHMALTSFTPPPAPNHARNCFCLVNSVKILFHSFYLFLQFWTFLSVHFPVNDSDISKDMNFSLGPGECFSLIIISMPVVYSHLASSFSRSGFFCMDVICRCSFLYSHVSVVLLGDAISILFRTKEITFQCVTVASCF